MDDDRNNNSSRSGSRERPRREFQEAVERLEEAVQDLVGSATSEFSGRASEFSDRASIFVDELTEKIEREFSSSASGRDRGYANESSEGRSHPADDARSRRRRRHARRQARYAGVREPRTRTDRLYRDPSSAKIVGVCAGIARYYGVENWVVRCIAVTGLLFLPSIVFPAYWIAYFVLDTPPREGQRSRRRHRSSGDDSSSAPELGPDLAPRQSLRNVEADLTEVELRLRRMESHVTSGQYELQRELHKIDPQANGSTPGRDA